MGHLLLGARAEVVVGVEAVGMDDLVADARVVGQRDHHDGLFTVGAAALVEDVSDGLGAERAALVRVADRRVERGSAVEIEEAEQARGRATEMSAVERDLG
jgi:hypothetical protein